MTNQNISVLYVGDNLSNVQNANWHIWHAQDVQEALANYIYYMPDVIIFDANCEITAEVFDHISSVTHASPRDLEAILMIGGGNWQQPQKSVMWQVHTSENLAEIVGDLLHTRDVESVWGGKTPARKIG